MIPNCLYTFDVCIISCILRLGTHSRYSTARELSAFLHASAHWRHLCRGILRHAIDTTTTTCRSCQPSPLTLKVTLSVLKPYQIGIISLLQLRFCSYDYYIENSTITLHKKDVPNIINSLLILHIKIHFFAGHAMGAGPKICLDRYLHTYILYDFPFVVWLIWIYRNNFMLFS